ncbi:hypothetical protein GCM10010503_45130 [Streptomyces lucensis JCM 4490]|uniref:Uncharacterized protein n=1 Tax=Streptomyces lucensis JCM 4490 TaxID=1306176 RepID=A0A918J995_9ACTN|nr:hypothetical protein [Streptomyces lucensis]GGW63055.1 hypothetical protein GCM10010503_45130 [Streptomyces lucensis JCM 4490]
MRPYCKAYRLGELRAFPEWSTLADGSQERLGADDIVYVRDDLTVVRTPVLTEESVILGQVTASWRRFCLGVLGFSVPDGTSAAAASGATE